MIIRVVRMHLKQQGVQPFLEVFDRHKEKIRAAKGCTHLELFRDVNNACVFVTVSHWQDEQCLEDYRKSELFKNVWSTVRSFFAAPSSAFSMHPQQHDYTRK